MNVNSTPREHSEVCACRECVQSLDLSGQVDPCGWVLRVTWSLDDELAHAEGIRPEGGEPISEDTLGYCQSEMDYLVARIEGKRFLSAEDLSRWLVKDLGCGDDFR